MTALMGVDIELPKKSRASASFHHSDLDRLIQIAKKYGVTDYEIVLDGPLVAARLVPMRTEDNTALAFRIVAEPREKSPEKTSLYRHFNKARALLYVGISVNPLERLRGHRATSHWYEQIEIVTIEHYPTREVALDAEVEAINTEKPLYNIARVEKSATKLEQEKIEREEQARRVAEENLHAAAAFEQQLKATQQERQAAAHKQQLEEQERQKLDILRREQAGEMKKRRPSWDGRLETYRSIYDAERPA
jgi:hypothetical protein